MVHEAGAFYVLDRGYTGFTSLKRIDNAGPFFVIRAKRDLRFSRVYSHVKSKIGNVRVDQTITLVVLRSREEYPDQLRRIKVFDAENNCSPVFLTNNFVLDALTVAELYRLRWKIELFFKWIKQHLRIKAFFGRTPNDVTTQIWIALSAYVLVAIVKKELGVEQPLYTILHTTNGGATWRSQNSGTTVDFDGISFTDIYNGWVSGASIRHTSDGGQTWAAQNSGTTNYLWSICFADANNGWAMGDAGTIRHTTDGGATWTGQISRTSSLLRTCSFVDANNGTAVGNYGTIVHTTNGGATWATQSSGTSNHLYGVSFIDANIGWAVGVGGVVLHTGQKIATGVNEEPLAEMPREFSLSQNYPNPFNPATVVRFQVAAGGDVTLRVFDVLGREVATLVNEEIKPGSHEVTWDASGFSRQTAGGLASEVYLCRLQAGDPSLRSGQAPSPGSGRGFVETKKSILLR